MGRGIERCRALLRFGVASERRCDAS